MNAIAAASVPMSAASLPPRVTRPSTAPAAAKPRIPPPPIAAVPSATNNDITHSNNKNNNNNVHFHHQQNYLHEAAAVGSTATTFSAGVARPRPSSAVVVNQRPIGARPLSGSSTRPTIANNNNNNNNKATLMYNQPHFHAPTGVPSSSSSATAQMQQTAASMTNRTAAVASVKGDILLLQRTIDKLSDPQYSNNNQQHRDGAALGSGGGDSFMSSLTLAAARDGLFEMEQILAHEFPPVLPGDESAAADMHAKLLELFIQRLNAGALQTLRSFMSPEECDRVSLVSRTSAISTLLNTLNSGAGKYHFSLAGRGGRGAPGAAATAASLPPPVSVSHVQTQTVSVGGLSAAELTDFQAMLKEQRDISAQMRKTMMNAGSSSDPAYMMMQQQQGSASATGTSATTTNKNDRAQIRAMKQELDEANRTIAQLQQELSALQTKYGKSESARLVALQQQQQQQQQQKSQNGGGDAAAASSSLNQQPASGRSATSANSGEGDRDRDGAGVAGAGALGVGGSGSGSAGGGAQLSASQNLLQSAANPELAMAIAVAATVGFHRVDAEVLTQVGLDAALVVDGARVLPDRFYAEQLAAKVSAAVSELQQTMKEDDAALAAGKTTASLTAAGRSTKSGKRDKPDSPEALASKIGAMWWVLEKQNATLQALQLLAAKQHDKLRAAENDAKALDARTKRVIAVLEDKMGHAKSMVQRLMEENETLQQQAANNHGSGNHNGRSSSQQSRTPSGEATPTGEQLLAGGRRPAGGAAAGAAGNPAVRTAVDDPTPEAVAKLHERTEIRLQRRLLELERDNAEKANFVDQARLNNATNHREIQALKAKATTLQKTLAESRATEEQALEEAGVLRAERDALKKEVRETKISATEAQQKVARLEVELHISQNIVEDLRRRELELQKASGDSRQCGDILKNKMWGEREQHARELARVREEHRAAKHEVIVANQILADERQKALANEREIERLRGLDLQLETLQQNFANYAGAKQAQKEAHEEEERALQACVELVGQDVFALPFGEESGEAEVELLLARLRDAEDSMAQEERTRDTLRSTVVGFRDERSGRKQLATLMQRRYNAIQIFACQQRLRQLQIERKLQDALVQNDEHRVQYQGVMVELAHARSHEQALLQRNSELEQQRRESLRGRESAESEVKALKSTIQRMRIANEEQEAAIVDLGTKLRRKEISQPQSGAAAGDEQQQPQQQPQQQLHSHHVSSSSMSLSSGTRPFTGKNPLK